MPSRDDRPVLSLEVLYYLYLVRVVYPLVLKWPDSQPPSIISPVAQRTQRRDDGGPHSFEADRVGRSA
jgi:hypothetical protein